MSANIIVSSFNKKSKKISYISQLVKHSFFLENQLEIYNIIRQAPNNVHYFYIFETATFITYNQMDDDLFVKNTNTHINNTVFFQKSNYYLLKYRECQLYSLNEYLDSILFSKKYMFVVLESYKKLLRAFELLSSLNIVYNDISKDNIFMDEQKEILLTHFQLSMHLNNSNKTSQYLKQYLKEYAPSYAYWPIEFHILSFLFMHNLQSISKINIEKIMDDVINENKIIKQIQNEHPDIIKSFREEGITYMCKYINKSVTEIVKDMCLYYDTWDNVGLSVFLIDLLKIKRLPSNIFLTNLSKLLIQNMHFVPTKRMTIVQTLLEVEDICYSTSKEIFTEMFRI